MLLSCLLFLVSFLPFFFFLHPPPSPFLLLASNRDIYMFDARAGSILGNIRAHEGDIVSILWLGDLPVLVSSDTKGYIYFWATNPASNKCQCLLRYLFTLFYF